MWGTAEKGIVSYALSPNRQRAMGGTLHAAVFNTWRRTKGSLLYWAPPMMAAYFIMSWANERYEFCHVHASC